MRRLSPEPQKKSWHGKVDLRTIIILWGVDDIQGVSEEKKGSLEPGRPGGTPACRAGLRKSMCEESEGKPTESSASSVEGVISRRPGMSDTTRRSRKWVVTRMSPL